MSESDRPKFATHIDAQIEAAQIHVDQMFWGQLQSMQVKIPTAERVYRLGFNFEAEPPDPKRPNALRSVIADYARNLYLAEANLYPVDRRIKRWLAKLSGRIAERILRTITELEAANSYRNASLTYHELTPDQMRDAALEEINRMIRDRLTPAIPTRLSNTAVQDQEAKIDAATPSATAGPGSTEIGQQRISLLAEYKRATGNPSNKKIYESSNSGIYKPEFYQWLNGKLPPKSRVTRRFESFLRAKRRPVPKNRSSES